MPPKPAIEVIKLVFEIVSTNLGILRIQFQNTQNQFLLRSDIAQVQKDWFWLVIMITSLLCTVLELYFNLTTKVNLIPTFYHGFMLFTKITTFSIGFVFRKNEKEVICFLNCILRNPDGIVCVTNRVHSKSQRKSDNIFVIVLNICTFSISLFFVPFVPMVVLILPCLHDNKVFKLVTYQAHCTTNAFRGIVFLFQVVFLTINSALTAITASVTLFTLNEIKINVGNLW